MKLYSDYSGRRAVQIAGDIIALVVLIGGIVLAVAIHNAIAAFVTVGADMERSGSGFATTMSDIGDTLAGVPLVGGGVRAPFDAASTAGDTLAAAGDRWQSGVETLAALTGWTVAGLVVVVVVLGWIVPRISGAVRQTAAARLAASPSAFDLLAFRALATRPVQHVAAVNAQAVTAWRRGDPEVIRRLAALELKASGVRLG